MNCKPKVTRTTRWEFQEKHLGHRNRKRTGLAHRAGVRKEDDQIGEENLQNGGDDSWEERCTVCPGGGEGSFSKPGRSSGSPVSEEKDNEQKQPPIGKTPRGAPLKSAGKTTPSVTGVDAMHP